MIAPGTPTTESAALGDFVWEDLNANGVQEANEPGIDGVTVTPKYQGGTAYSAGNASSIDVYTYTVTKTADRTYTVLMSQTQFK
jgi:hypothetical protein